MAGIERLAQRVRRYGLLASPFVRVAKAKVIGKLVYFVVANTRDSIQECHLAGGFYESEELEIIRRHCPPGAIFLDVGANVGNHSLFAALFLEASKVIAIEPNPKAADILLSNICLNRVEAIVDTSNLGFGLSDSSSENASIVVDSENNLGGGRVVSGGGTIMLRTGDELLQGQSVDFIKIDVEGMEMQVIAGLQETISRDRPPIFVEVDNANHDAFTGWVAQNGYAVVERFRRYEMNENFLVQHQPRQH